MLQLVPVVIGAVHVAAAVLWLAALLLGIDPGTTARVVPAPVRSWAEVVRARPVVAVTVVALSGLGLTAIELTEGAGGTADRAVVHDPSTLWVALIAAKAALLAGVAGVGAVVGPLTPAGAGVDGRGDRPSAAAARTEERAVVVSAGLVGAALVLGLVADAIGVGV
jgi:hypothetical protein